MQHKRLGNHIFPANQKAFNIPLDCPFGHNKESPKKYWRENIENVRVVTSVERRRKFTNDEKTKILEELRDPGATIVGIAKRHGMSPSLIHLWKKNASAQPNFVPVAFSPIPAMIKINLWHDISIDFPASTDFKLIAKFLKELRN